MTWHNCPSCSPTWWGFQSESKITTVSKRRGTGRRAWSGRRGGKEGLFFMYWNKKDEDEREKQEMRNFPKWSVHFHCPLLNTHNISTWAHNTNDCMHHVFVDTVKLTQEHSVWPAAGNHQVLEEVEEQLNTHYLHCQEYKYAWVDTAPPWMRVWQVLRLLACTACTRRTGSWESGISRISLGGIRGLSWDTL